MEETSMTGPHELFSTDLIMFYCIRPITYRDCCCCAAIVDTLFQRVGMLCYGYGRFGSFGTGPPSGVIEVQVQGCSGKSVLFAYRFRLQV